MSLFSKKSTLPTSTPFSFLKLCTQFLLILSLPSTLKLCHSTFCPSSYLAFNSSYNLFSFSYSACCVLDSTSLQTTLLSAVFIALSFLISPSYRVWISFTVFPKFAISWSLPLQLVQLATLVVVDDDDVMIRALVVLARDNCQRSTRIYQVFALFSSYSLWVYYSRRLSCFRVVILQILIYFIFLTYNSRSNYSQLLRLRYCTLLSCISYIFYNMTIKLYLDYMSQPSRAVWALCLLAKVPVELKQIRISKLQMRSQEYKKINPMAKVPAIEDTENGFKLAESHSIMRYLCNKYPEHVGDWYPAKCYVERAKIDEYLDFHHTNTRKCSYLIFNAVFAKNIGIPTDPQYVEAEARKAVDRALKAISNHYLANTDYITGSKPTIADLSAYYEIQFLVLTGENFDKWPKIKAWLERMGQIKEVREANKVFIKLAAKVNPTAKL